MLKNKNIYILIIVVFTVALGIYGLSLRLFSLKDCQNLGEEQCQDRTDCAAIYDNGFKECAALSGEIQKQISQAKNICEETGGQWQKTKFGDYCNCANIYPARQYVSGQGCVEK